MIRLFTTAFAAALMALSLSPQAFAGEKAIVTVWGDAGILLSGREIKPDGNGGRYDFLVDLCWEEENDWNQPEDFADDETLSKLTKNATAKAVEACKERDGKALQGRNGKPKSIKGNGQRMSIPGHVKVDISDGEGLESVERKEKDTDSKLYVCIIRAYIDCKVTY